MKQFNTFLTPKYFVNLLTKAVELKDKQEIIRVYTLIEESDVDFYNVPKSIGEKYDTLVEKANIILGY